jgi:hypothetical protein
MNVILLIKIIHLKSIPSRKSYIHNKAFEMKYTEGLSNEGITKMREKCGWTAATYWAMAKAAKIVGEDQKGRPIKQVTLQDMYKFLPWIVMFTDSKAVEPSKSLQQQIQILDTVGLTKMGYRKKAPTTVENDPKNAGIYRLEFRPMNSLELTRLLEKKRKSQGEYIIEEFLNILQIDFKREKTFSGLRDKNLLRFDFYFIHQDREFFIEFDGVQHRTGVKIWGGENAKLVTIYHDSMKNHFVIERGGVIMRFSKLSKAKIRFLIVKTILEVLFTTNATIHQSNVISCDDDVKPGKIYSDIPPTSGEVRSDMQACQVTKTNPVPGFINLANYGINFKTCRFEIIDAITQQVISTLV